MKQKWITLTHNLTFLVLDEMQVRVKLVSEENDLWALDGVRARYWVTIPRLRWLTKVQVIRQPVDVLI